MRSILSLPILVWVCLLFLLDQFTVVCVSGQTVTIPSPVSGPYERPWLIDSASVGTNTLIITQPPELAGTLLWAHSPGAGPLFNVSAADAAAGNFDISLPIIMPHSSEADDRYGCSPFTYPINDEGQPLAGSILLLERRGGCNFAGKGGNVSPTGARALAIHNCPGCSDGYIRISAAIPENMVNMFLTAADGYTIRAYLQGRRDWLKNVTTYGSYPMPAGHNYTLPVMGTVVGTGPLNSIEMSALLTVAASFKLNGDQSDSVLRTWDDINAHPNLDPCLNRVNGIYCERGSIHTIYIKSYGLVGPFSPAWGAFTSLQFLTVDENSPYSGFVGAVPPEICQLTQLKSLQLEANSLTTLPDCLGTSLTKLQVLLVERNNVLTTLPKDVSGLTSLVWFTASANAITTLPTTISTWSNIGLIDVNTNPKLTTDVSTLSFTSWYQVYSINLANSALTGGFQSTAFNGLTKLATFDVNHNSLTGSIPAFTGAPLTYLDMSYNSFSGSLTVPSNLAATLTTLNLGHNSLSGQLPGLAGFSSLTSLNMQSNQFTGDLPTTWSTLTALTTLTMDNNQLVGPLNTLYSMPALTVAHFEHNSLVLPSTSNGNVGVWLDHIVGPGLVEFDLDYNQLGPTWGTGWVHAAPKFAKLSFSHNLLTNLPDDIFSTTLTSMDFSYNQIVGDIPPGLNSDPAKAYVTEFNVDGNPGLNSVVSGGVLPTWLQVATPASTFTSSDGYYSCPVLGSPTYAAFRFSYAPSTTSYYGCVCAKGRFGVAPNCDIVPVEATISPYGLRVVSNETAIQAADPTLFMTLLSGYDSAPNGAITNNGSRAITLPPAFSDSWYGTDRLTVGLSTYWSIDLSTVRLRPNQTESGFFPPVDAKYIAGTDPNQPVRVITVRLHISAAYFTGISNVLTVTEGTHSNQGALVKSIFGLGFSSTYTQRNSSFTLTPQYQARYGASIAALVDPRLVEIQVLSNMATVAFSSRDSANSHFIGTYSYEFACPAGQGLELDSSNTCTIPTHSSNMLLILATIAGCLLFLTFIWLIRERVIRQRAKQAKSRELFSLKASDLVDDLSEVELSQSQYDKMMQKEHAYGMKKEFAVTVVMIIIECGFVATTWLNVNSLLSTISSNNISLAYLVIAVVSTMAFLVNLVSRVLGLAALYHDIQTEELDAHDHRTYKLIKLERKILRLKITSIGLLFDSIPVVGFNFYRLYSGNPDLQKIISFMLGSFLLGLKIARISEFSVMKKERLKMQYEVYQAKKLAIEQNRRTSIIAGKRSSIIASPTTIDSPKPIAIDSPSHSGSSRPNVDTINLHIPSSMVDTITTTKSIESNHSPDLPTPLIRQTTATSPKSKSFRIFQMEKSCQLCAQAHKREGHATINNQQQQSRVSSPTNAHIHYHSPNGHGPIQPDHAVEMTPINAPVSKSSPPTSPTPPPAYILPTTLDRRRSTHITDAYIEDIFGPSNGDSNKF